MGTPVRNLIQEEIATTLATISTANGYKTNVTTVSRVIKDWASVLSSEFPWIGFSFPKENIVHRPFGWLEMRLRGHVVGHVNPTGDGLTEQQIAALRSDQLSDLQDDIIAVLSVDVTRGGYAISTQFGTTGDGETDEGDPDTMDSRGGTGSLVVPFEVFYEREQTKS